MVPWTVGRITAFFIEVQRQLAINSPPLCRPIALSSPEIPPIPFENSMISADNHHWNEYVMGAPVSIVLQRNERKKYEQLSRSGKTPVRLKERLTLADDGLNNNEIAEHMSISAHMAGRWRNRFPEKLRCDTKLR